jgi:hypothetical protein
LCGCPPHRYGLQPPRQGRHGVHQELHPPKSLSRCNFTEKFALTYI